VTVAGAHRFNGLSGAEIWYRPLQGVEPLRLGRLDRNDRYRRISPVPVRPGEGPFSIAASVKLRLDDYMLSPCCASADDATRGSRFRTAVGVDAASSAQSSGPAAHDACRCLARSPGDGIVAPQGLRDLEILTKTITHYKRRSRTSRARSYRRHNGPDPGDRRAWRS
jgi:hypothetical protein